MFKKLNLKTQVIFIVSCVLIIFLSVQLCLYDFLRKSNDETISSIFNSISKSTISQVEKVNNEIEEISFLLSVHSDIQQSVYEDTNKVIIKKLNILQSLMDDYRARNINILSLSVIKNHKPFLSSFSQSFYYEINDYILNLKEKENIKKLAPHYFFDDGNTYFLRCIPINPVDVSYFNTTNSGNYVICIYTIDVVNNNIYHFIDDEQINFNITDKNNTVILSSDEEKHNSKLPSQSKRKGLCYTGKISDTGWNIQISMQKEIFSQFSSFFKAVIFITILTIVAAALILIYCINKFFVKRILTIKDVITRLPDNYSHIHISYKYNDEIKELTDIFNQLLDELIVLNEKNMTSLNELHSLQMLQNETHIYYLYNQVSPHFLYNTMTHIQGLAFKYNAHEIVKVITEFSKVLRYYSNNSSHSTLINDLEYAISYFNVINIRRENPIELDMNIDKELYNIKCLKMIFQPVLENTLKHAFSPDEIGHVKIYSVPSHDNVIINIEDDGCGMNEEALSKLIEKFNEDNVNIIKTHNSEKVGLTNVHLRLRLAYNDKCGLVIKSTPDKGTCVSVIFSKKFPENN